jgi:cytochrome oxidase Cu insertion factor (SCO1/SenC/PrrC family)
MIRALVATAACAAAVAGSGCGATVDAPAPPTTTSTTTGFRGTLLNPPLRAPDFTLHDQTDKLVRLSAERGRYVIVTFLYTHTPTSIRSSPTS